MIHMTHLLKTPCLASIGRLLFAAGLALVVWGWANHALAATLSVTPDTGVYTVGQTFTARVVLNTGGESINAADARISFDSSQLSVVSVNDTGSVFNLWAEEPAVNGNAVTFSGGAPRGYSGSSGTILTMTLRVESAGTARLSFQDGSALAADGAGTNVLDNMNGASYTVQAPSSAPEPEVVQYVPAVNTPAAPQVSSPTHPDSAAWYQATDATFAWSLPSGVTGVRTSLGQSANAIPDELADGVIESYTASNLPNGTSYFHVQLRNEDGWGEVARYRVSVSDEDLDGVSVALPDDVDATNPTPQLTVDMGDTVAPASHALIQIDGQDPREQELTGATSTLQLPELDPGYHTVVVEVFDVAGNSVVKSLSFTIKAFAAPEFTEVPDTVNTTVIPVFRGTTRPDAAVEVTLRDVANDTNRTYTMTANASGTFEVIPEERLPAGVYELQAVATDARGAKSETSQPVRFAVQEAGYVAIGSWLVDVLSIVVPLVATVLLLIALLWYAWYRVRRLRQRVSRESGEVHEVVEKQFTELHTVLDDHLAKVRKSRKSKELTKAETALADSLRGTLKTAQEKIMKEVEDVEDLTPSQDYDNNS